MSICLKYTLKPKQTKSNSKLTTGDEILQPGQSQIGGCTCKIPLDISVFRLFPKK